MVHLHHGDFICIAIVLLVGIPLQKARLSEIIEELGKHINFDI